MPLVHVTQHAVDRYRQRVLPRELEPTTTDDQIREAIRDACYSPLMSVMTLRNFGGKQKIMKHYFKGRCAGCDFYAVTDRQGERIFTILSEKESMRWTVYAVFQRIPRPDTNRPGRPKWTWKALDRRIA